MKKRALAAAALSLGLSPLVAVAPAQADTPGCVTRTEFSKVVRGMTMPRVHRIFDTRGVENFRGFGSTTREYTPCTDREWGFVNVSYERRGGLWRVTSKFAYWG